MSATPLRFAYADPPYPGQARKHYRADPRCAEVDHAALLVRLGDYDGWALSTSSPALRDVLAICPSGVRVGSWVKPFASFKRGVNPAYAWEPVIYRPCSRERDKDAPTVRDWVSASIATRRGVHGAKPDGFSYWLFDLLGMRPGDDFYDLYPGSGAVSRAWQRWRSQLWAVAQ